MPLALDETSEPEPDIAVVVGVPRDYRDAHPTTAVLVVEVSDATLALDRQRKKTVYARRGIKEYWVLNLLEARLEVYRDPKGEDYQDVRSLTGSDKVSPLACPVATIAVADLLP